MFSSILIILILMSLSVIVTSFAESRSSDKIKVISCITSLFIYICCLAVLGTSLLSTNFLQKISVVHLWKAFDYENFSFSIDLVSNSLGLSLLMFLIIIGVVTKITNFSVNIKNRSTFIPTIEATLIIIIAMFIFLSDQLLQLYIALEILTFCFFISDRHQGINKESLTIVNSLIGRLIRAFILFCIYAIYKITATLSISELATYYADKNNDLTSLSILLFIFLAGVTIILLSNSNLLYSKKKSVKYLENHLYRTIAVPIIILSVMAKIFPIIEETSLIYYVGLSLLVALTLMFGFYTFIKDNALEIIDGANMVQLFVSAFIIFAFSFSDGVYIFITFAISRMILVSVVLLWIAENEEIYLEEKSIIINKEDPFSFWIIVISFLSIIGFPGFASFFSINESVGTAYNSGDFGFTSFLVIFFVNIIIIGLMTKSLILLYRPFSSISKDKVNVGNKVALVTLFVFSLMFIVIANMISLPEFISSNGRLIQNYLELSSLTNETIPTNEGNVVFIIMMFNILLTVFVVALTYYILIIRNDKSSERIKKIISRIDKTGTPLVAVVGQSNVAINSLLKKINSYNYYIINFVLVRISEIAFTVLREGSYFLNSNIKKNRDNIFLYFIITLVLLISFSFLVKLGFVE